MRRKNNETPMAGAIVKCRNGMTGEVIGVRNSGSYREEYEILVEGTRCYVRSDEVKVVNVLDRIARELDKD